MGFGADGKRIRRKVSGRTGTEVKDKLQLLHDELRQGLRSSQKFIGVQMNAVATATRGSWLLMTAPQARRPVK